MTESSRSVFDAHAGAYDVLRRRLIPCFDAFYEGAVDALALAGRPLQRILDLGAGTGLLSARVIAAYPAVELVLIDSSPAMLEQARVAFGGRAESCVADLRDPLPDGTFDAVVSALAIHHIDDADKRDLFGRVRAALSPGGVFVNAEQVAGPTARLDTSYRAWHREASAALGTTAEDWRDAVRRMELDRCATTEAQLAWLRDAGFADADCLFRDHCFAVLFARTDRG